jgi:predicted Zn-ribbon and HTH transcriptional regulator
MKSRIYLMECPDCGHELRDNHISTRCHKCKTGKYDIIFEYPGEI